MSGQPDPGEHVLRQLRLLMEGVGVVARGVTCAPDVARDYAMVGVLGVVIVANEGYGGTA